MRYQITVFVLSYISYSSVHSYREFWSVSKPKIEDQKDKYHVGEEILSNIDFTNFLCYGLSQFINGVLADKINLRLLLPIDFLI